MARQQSQNIDCKNIINDDYKIINDRVSIYVTNFRLKDVGLIKSRLARNGFYFQDIICKKLVFTK